MRIFLCDLHALPSEEAARMLNALPPARREAAARCRTEAARLACAVGYHLIRYAAAQLGVTLPLTDLETEAHGKPYVAGNPVYFSLSHSEHCVAAAISKAHPVGLDIEKIVPRREGFAARWFSKGERTRIAAAPDCDAELTRLWTAKEATVKRSGQGLGFDIQGIEATDTVCAFFTLDDARFALSLCPGGDLPVLEWVAPSELLL